MPEIDHSNQSNRPTLEDLLRLKRSERPSPEFWNRFEQELRQKQLVALMDRKPWWHALTRHALWGQAMMPIGAAAVLSIVYLSNHTWQPVPTNGIPLANEEQRAVASHPTANTASLPATIQPLLAQSVHEQIGSYSVVATPEAPVSQGFVVLSPQLPERAMETIPWVATSSSQGLPAHLMMLDLGAEATATPGFTSVPMTASFAQAALSAPSKTAESNAELTTVSQQSSRRGRLLAQFSERQFAREPQAPAHLRERLARRLADASIPDQITRIGLKGDQVSLRF